MRRCVGRTQTLAGMDAATIAATIIWIMTMDDKEHVPMNTEPTSNDNGATQPEPLELGIIDDLESLVSIQPDATVSRTVMSGEGGNVVLFSFDKGQELSEHTAAMPVFVQTLKGRLTITGNGQTTELVPGGLVYFPTRIPHAVYAEEPSIMMLTMITPARKD